MRLCEGRTAPEQVRVDMMPSLDTQAGMLGEALADTILDGIPGVEGGGRFQRRRYHNGWLTAAPIGGDPGHQ